MVPWPTPKSSPVYCAAQRPARPMTISHDHGLPAVVLDTNVALDWLLFDDPSVAELADRIGRQAWRWLACDRMRDELAVVLSRAPFAARRVDCEHALTSFDRLSIRVALAGTSAIPASLRCLDADDQVFVDFAVEHRVRWLFTRDKALLALAPAARSHGLAIVAPARWRPDDETTP